MAQTGRWFRYDITNKISGQICWIYEGGPGLVDPLKYPLHTVVVTDITSELVKEERQERLQDLYPKHGEVLEALLDAIIRRDLTALTAIDAKVQAIKIKIPAAQTAQGLGAFEWSK